MTQPPPRPPNTLCPHSPNPESCCLCCGSNKFSDFRFQQFVSAARLTRSGRAQLRDKIPLVQKKKRIHLNCVISSAGWETLYSDPPVSDESVLDVAVWVFGWRGPASLYTQHQVSRYLSHKHTTSSVIHLVPSTLWVNNSCSWRLSQHSGDFLLTCGECWIAWGIIHSILPNMCDSVASAHAKYRNTSKHAAAHCCVCNCCCCCVCDTISWIEGCPPVLYHKYFYKDVVVERQRGHGGPPVLEGLIFVQQHRHGEVSILCVERDGSIGEARNKLQGIKTVKLLLDVPRHD